MNGAKILRIIGLWLVPGVAMLGYTFYSSPMAGAFMFSVLLSFIFVAVGAPLHIFFAWKNGEWPDFKSALWAFFILFLIFVFIAGLGAFNFT